MFLSLFKKEEKKAEKLNSLYEKIKSYYNFESINEMRKKELCELMEKFSYLPYPHIKALEELSPAEVLFALEKKWQNEGVFDNGSFNFENSKISPYLLISIIRKESRFKRIYRC